MLQGNRCGCTDEGGRKSVCEVLKKDRECIHCEKFFDCPGKPEKVKLCVNFVERKDEDG